MDNLTLTPEMFEASKILAPAICRGRASLFFDGYGIRKYLQIYGSSYAGSAPNIRIKITIEFNKTTHQIPLFEYMNLKWADMQALLSELCEPNWITLERK